MKALQFAIVALLLTAVLSTAAPAPNADPDKLPTSPFPRAVVAKMAGDALLVQETVPVYVERVATDSTGRAIKYTSVVMETRTAKYKAADVKVTDLAGKAVEGKDLDKALEKDVLVLVSADGKPLDPGFRKLFKDGTLVLLMPQPNVVPAPTPMPAPGK